ncbi:MAG: ABC transporter permease [Isosphaeraceae bacterium]|nr:ABC transporter permease [Isosphaeraceae bacterium]
MGRFAWKNLLTRPMRTVLALVGLSIPILGVIGLFSLTGGLRSLVGDTLGKIQGVMVMRENVPSPVLSRLPSSVEADLKKIEGIRVVAPEIFDIAPPVEGRNVIGRSMADFVTQSGTKRFQSMIDMPIVQGQDIIAHQDLRSGVYPTALKDKGEGRFLMPSDIDSNRIVISRKIAREYPNADGTPKKPGDRLKIGGEDFEIVGLYETGSMLLDVVIVMDINTARKLLKTPDTQVSSYYVEMDDPILNDRVTEEIERRMPGIDARSMNEFMANFGMLMGQLDLFLLMTVSLALLVGVVGIVNTMLMSTTERFTEFGVLRTNGWSRMNLLTLVTAESAYLGLLAGLIGGVLALLGTSIANQFITGGLTLRVPAWLFALGVGLSVVTGTLGGLYPAWKASRMVPMDAIRLGAH